jgi:signal transduction histidine kinase/HAMP domain-containing protein
MPSSLLVRFRRLGLQQRIMLYVSGGLAVVLAAYSVVSLQAIRQSTNLVFQERLAVARAVGQEIDMDVLHLQRELNEAGDAIGPALVAGHPGDARAALDAVYEHWSSYDGFDNPCVISLTDVNGLSLSIEPRPAGCPTDLSRQPVLQAASQSQQAAVTDEVTSDPDSHGGLWLAVPVSTSNQVVGYLVANVSLSRISQRFAPMLELSKSGYDLELIDQAGVTIASTQSTQLWTVSQHFPLISDLVARGQSGVMVHVMPAGSDPPTHVIAFAPLSAARWGVVVEEPVDTALELPRTLQNQLLVFGGGVLVIGLALAWVTTRSVVRPVNALINATQGIAAGQLDHPLDITGEGEVGRLARSFDEMRVELKQSREEIARWNRELENRVEQRTRELAALVESSHALTSTLDLDTLFVILIQQVRAVLPASEGTVLFLFDDGAQRLVARSAFGLDLSPGAPLRFQGNEAIAGRVFERQAPALLRTVAEAEADQANLSPENRARFSQAVGERAVQSALGVPLTSKGARLGTLVVYNFSRPAAFGENNVSMLQALANQAAAALENARLYAALQEKEAARAVLLEKVITAQEAERQRVAREIHDELGQLLTRLSINLKLCEADLSPQSAQAAQSFAAMQTLVWQTIEHAHHLVVELRPILLDELGLEAALHEEFHQRLAPFGVETTLTTYGALERLPASVEITVFRIAQEAISNIARHAHAHAATLSLRRDGAALWVSIEDDGVGVPADWRARGDGHRPVGLLGMQERATLLGGTLTIEPRSPHGTRVALNVPLTGDA